MPPSSTPGVMLVNPPYGERIEAGGFAGKARWGARELPETEQADDGNEFFSKLATHWKKNYAGWTAWVLTPDLKLPGKMRLKESRRVPMWNGPLECRLFKFEMIKGAVRERPTTPTAS
jgi:putative N6-adenine-specific DNA methylase